MSRIEGLRLVAAFVFAPAIGVLVLLGALTINQVMASGFEQNYEFLAAFGMIAAYMAYSVTFIVALPLFILFRIRGWLRPWQLATGGLLVGALVGLLPGTHIVFGLMFSAVGVTTGLAFWIIAIFRNRALTPGSRTDAPIGARG
jgi:hypothetical protein